MELLRNSRRRRDSRTDTQFSNSFILSSDIASFVANALVTPYAIPTVNTIANPPIDRLPLPSNVGRPGSPSLLA